MYSPYGTPAPPSRRPLWPWLVFAVVLAVLVSVVAYLVYFAPSPSGGGRPDFGYFGGFLVVFLLVWIAFFALRMALWRSFRSGYRGGNRAGGRDPAVVAARQRYARGEITREQFHQIMVDLGRRPPGPPGASPPP